MPANKSQHYVPVFYLKLFSSDPDKRSIGLFNFNSSRFVLRASIRDQSCRDYFYGDDGTLERNLASLESDAARLLGWMRANNIHPRYKSKGHRVLLTFIFFMRARTLASAETYDDMLNRSVQQIYSRDPEFKKTLSQVKVVHTNPAQVALSNMALAMPLVTDLAYKILLNKTSTPFITSDNPVVFYNQFFEHRSTLGSHTGLASMGLQVFFPIGPYHLVCLYDKDTYRVHGIFHRPVPLTSSADVDSINGLQFLAAESNLYFSAETPEDYLRSLIQPLTPYRRSDRSAVREFKGHDTPDGRKTALIMTYPEDIHSNFELSIVKLTKHAEQFTLDNRTGYFRNDRMLDLYDEFDAEVNQGRYQPSQFYEFLHHRTKH